MIAIAILLILGVVMICLEIVLPGMILGIFGALCIVAGCIFAITDYGPAAGALCAFGAILLTMILVFFEFKFLKKSNLGKGFFLSAVSGGDQSNHSVETRKAESPMNLVGQTCEATTRLAPTGKVLIENQVYEALSQDGLIEKGETVKVLSQAPTHLIVRKEA